MLLLIFQSEEAKEALGAVAACKKLFCSLLEEEKLLRGALPRGGEEAEQEEEEAMMGESLQCASLTSPPGGVAHIHTHSHGLLSFPYLCPISLHQGLLTQRTSTVCSCDSDTAAAWRHCWSCWTMKTWMSE